VGFCLCEKPVYARGMIIEPGSDRPSRTKLAMQYPGLERSPLWREARQVKPDTHSKVVPLLPIPNRTVKRLRADDSGRTSVKVGQYQAVIRKENPAG
jgi:hypothetical protein